MIYTYNETRHNPPKLKVVEKPREVIFDIVSCMCDNMHKLYLTKDANGDFKLNGGGHSLANYQMEFDYKLNIEWAADEDNWDNVIKIINTGTSLACAVRSR